MINNLGRKKKLRDYTLNMLKKIVLTSNGTGQSIRTAALLRHRTAENTPINKIPMFFVSPF